jgi:hypothetical protein
MCVTFSWVGCHDSDHALFVGLFDMSLRVVVDIICTSKLHPLDESLTSSRSSRCAPSGFFSRSPTLVELFSAPYLL